MKAISGTIVRNKKGISDWDPLLKKWVVLNNTYCEVMRGGDAPWLFTERALTGLLSASAWQCGRVSLEEFQYEKGHKYSKKWNGRVDLYITSSKSEYLVEAKYKWLSLNSKKSDEMVSNVMQKAVRDTKNTLGGDTDITGVAVSYFPMYMKRSAKKDVTLQIENCVSSIAKSVDYHAMAWVFPSEYRAVVNHAGNLCPGVILLAKNVAYV